VDDAGAITLTKGAPVTKPMMMPSAILHGYSLKLVEVYSDSWPETAFVVITSRQVG
jgi:hypothetical protein